MKKYLFLFVLALIALSTPAQIVPTSGIGNTIMVNFPGAPSGTCINVNVATNIANGNFYDCLTGSWNLVAGGGGSGTVTSVVIAGTANQITVAGTCTITTTGTCTISLPAAIALGADNTTAGTLTLANGSAAAHNIFASGAITTNTIQGFAIVPTTGHLIDCTVTSTTCLLHDSGVVTANVVSNSGTPLIHQVAIWTNATTIKGITGATIDDSGNMVLAGTLTTGGCAGCAGAAVFPQGTANTVVANSWLIEAPTSIATGFKWIGPNAAATGFVLGTASGTAVTISQVASTGSGNVVLATSPTLVTPALGTPSALVLTNATSLPCGAMPALTGDATTSATSCATTVVKINGTSFAGTSTHLVAFGAANIPVDSGIVDTAAGLLAACTGCAPLAAPVFTTSITTPTMLTTTKCAATGTAASPSVVSCSAAPSGSFSCATNASTATCTINTTAMTANSAVFVQPDASLGMLLSVTCNTTADTGLTAPRVATRSGGTSFTINLGTFVTNPLCFNYWIVN